jgi:precorrin-8X/cobalt-precorrin-8 methylmutase
VIETDLVLQGLLADLSDRSEFEVDLLSKLVLACGDVSLVPFVDIGNVPTVIGAIDHTRLAHLKCSVETLIADPPITSAADAEASFWSHYQQQDQWQQLNNGCIRLVGYTP